MDIDRAIEIVTKLADGVDPTTSGGAEYKLRHADEAVRFVYTDLTCTNAADFLTTELTTCGASANQNSYEADSIKVTDSGVILASAFLDKIAANPDKGILMLEGIAAKTNALVLEIWKNGDKVCETELHISLSGVEEMYRWINLRGVVGGDEDRVTDTDEPANFPDAMSNGKQFVFVHGYNVDENKARGWNSEMFKRLYQSGSKAMFTALTWHGDDGQIIGLEKTLDYYQNVEHAFEAASSVVTEVNNLPGAKYIAAHSLGNMAVSSAIVDHGLNVNTYFMLNAAVAMETYDAAANNQADLRNPDWQSYSNHLWASEWHTHFSTNDSRGTLTWRGRFNNIQNEINYYSSAEDVLNNGNGAIPNIWFGDSLPNRAWCRQEMVKGTTGLLIPGNEEGGWGFNSDYSGLTVAQANVLSEAMISTNSFFLHFDDEELYGENGSAFLLDGQTNVHHSPVCWRLLADAIPALSNPSGRNTLGNAVQGNRDYMTHGGTYGFRRGNYPDDWPRDGANGSVWRHSDIKDIAYPYNYKAFDQIVNDGGLE